MSVTVYKDILGKTLTRVEVDKVEARIVFTSECGRTWVMQHYQDCCENVYIEDIIGALRDLVGAPLLMAEEVRYENVNPDGTEESTEDNYRGDSFTWTFYKFATVKGYVTIRWYGSSNGYYSERVSFEEIKEN